MLVSRIFNSVGTSPPFSCGIGPLHSRSGLFLCSAQRECRMPGAASEPQCKKELRPTKSNLNHKKHPTLSNQPNNPKKRATGKKTGKDGEK